MSAALVPPVLRRLARYRCGGSAQAWSRSIAMLMSSLGALVLLHSSRLSASDDDGWTATVRPLLQNYCWECHGEKMQKGDLDLQDIATLAELTARGDVLAGIEKRLANDEMPPTKAKQPTPQERTTLVRWLTAQLERGHPQIPGDPGRVVMPHVTRTQYERIIRDLTGMSLPLASQLPTDGGAGEGFDNVGAAQVVTTMHVQAYLTTATQIASHARVLPGLPIEWRQESSSYEARSSEELFAILASEFRRQVSSMWTREVADHLASLKSVLPTEDQWQQSTTGYSQGGWRWLVVYLHAAWQYHHRAALGHPDWTPADTAAAYQPPLRKEILTRLVTVIEGKKSWNMYWNQIVSQWQLMPPPPLSDKEGRAQCFKLLAWCMRHMYVRNHDTTAPPENDVLLPIEVDPRAYLKQSGEPYFVMMNEGRHPFRFKLGASRDLYLVTTDANDGSDEDVMIWEKGIITRDGHEEPWTGLVIRDRAEAPLEWGSHPMGAAANLPKDSIAVHAPAVLHLTFPAGTTHFRVDARADPVYAKNGSMQTVPFDHPPTDDDLHFAPVRYVFAAPGSTRQKAIMGASELTYLLSGSQEFIDPWNLLPPELKGRWGHLHDKSIAVDWGQLGNPGAPPVPESIYGSGKFPQGWPGDDLLWKGSSAFLLDDATDAERARLAHITDQLKRTDEARDALAYFLADQKVHLETPADALTAEPIGLSPEAAQKHHAMLEAAKADEARLLGCAREQITAFAERAWRRAPPEPSVTGLLNLYQHGRDEGLCYEASMKRALAGVLISPLFLYREQPAQQHDAPYALGGRELAERLASVVWGSIPDAELLQAGASGQLATSDGLRQQIQRMIADRRSQALAAEFAGQVFLFAGFDTFRGPDATRFPQFTPAVRDAMYKECLSFFGNLFKEDRPLTDVIDANYTFLNQELASFYGIDGVTGPEFRKVTVNPAQRGGILGMGAFLTSSSLPLRTSPIRRGNWVLSHLMGTPPPPPPPVVPQLSGGESDDEKQTIVQQMKRHRTDPMCMSCHERIDPLGVSLESFDAIGRRRTKLQDGSPVNEQEMNVDGSMLQSFSGLKSYLSRDPQRQKILRNLCGKFVGYALGRGLIPSDQGLIDHLMEDLAAQDWRSSALVMGVLTSPEFTRRRDEAEATASSAGSAKQNKQKEQP